MTEETQQQRSNNHKKGRGKFRRSSSSREKHQGGQQNQAQDKLPRGSPPMASTNQSNAPIDIPDPRSTEKRITNKASKRGTGRNTESFDPKSTLVRPAIRVYVGSPSCETYKKPLKHDDVVIVPELFGSEDNEELYHQLLEEMKDRKDWTSWHEGAHLIVKHPSSPTFNNVLDRLCQYFQIDPKSIGYRFNWYKDSNDWKPFHHDSAAFNPHRAKTQNITVGVSFGACRELAFLLASDPSTRLYFPQTNNGVFSFGRDVNIRWKHGINALPKAELSNKGRISIIVWGLAQHVIEEPNSPPLLGSDGKGPHAAAQQNRRKQNNNQRRRQRRPKGGNAGKENKECNHNNPNKPENTDIPPKLVHEA